MAATSPSLTRPAPAWRARLDRFWRWWSSELLAMVPERFASFAGAARVPLLGFEGTRITMLEPRPAAGKAPESVETAELDSTRAAAAVRGMLERAGETRGRARLALAPGEALVRRATMPAATEENLSTVLGFEMDRLTPFRAEDVHYDHQVIGRDGAANTITVVLAVARREVVEARLAQARALGVSVQGVAVREDPLRSGPALDVLPRTERGERERPSERMAKRALAAVALLLLLGALFVPALRKRSDVIALKPSLDHAHAEAQATDSLIRELERLTGDYNFLLERKHSSYPVLAYIEEVSRLLPDNTWLQQMEIKAAGKGREILISGETVSSSRLIEILEQSRLLQNATPRGAVTRGSQPGTERFVISSEARARTMPEAVPASQPASPVALNPAYAPAQANPAQAPAPAAAAPAAGPATAVVTPAPTTQPKLLFKPRGKTLTPEEIARGGAVK